MKRSTGLGLSAALLATSLVACAPGDGTAGGECATGSAACSLSDVDPQVLTRMIDLSEEAHELSLRPDVTWGDVGHFLDEQDDVVNVTVTAVEISFQVAGAPPSYLLSELAAPSDGAETADDGVPESGGLQPDGPGPDPADDDAPDPDSTDPDSTDPGSTQPETPDWFPEDRDRAGEVAGGSPADWPNNPEPEGIVRNAAWTPSSSAAVVPVSAAVPIRTDARTTALPSVRQEPVGEPGVGHDRAPTKRAFIFEPYGPMGARAVPRDLAGVLGAQDQYKVDFFGDVTDYEDSAEILNALMSLGSYDVVYISSHGARNGFAASNARDWFVKNPGEDTYSIPESRPVPYGVGTARGPDGDMRFYVTDVFFEYHYPGGLSDTLFFGDWCQSALGDQLGSAILGPGSVYLGWDQSVGVDLAARAARYFWEGAVDWRVDSTAAYENVVEHGAHFQPERNIVSHGIDCARGSDDEGMFNCPERYTSTLQIFTSQNPLHVIDTVTSYSNDKRIRKGTVLGWSGDADDGVKDTLDEIQLEVVGIVPGQAGAAGYVEIVIDGKKVEEKFPVIEMAVTDTDGTHWEERAIDLEDVELPFDVTAEQQLRELPWEVRLVGPNNSISMHDVDGVRLMGPKLTVVDPELSYELADGDDLAADDEENDGKPGRTTIALHVADIAPEVAVNYRVEIEVTGGTLQGTRELEWSLNEFRHLGESLWRKDQVIDLDFDLTEETRPFTVSAQLFQKGDGTLDPNRPLAAPAPGPSDSGVAGAVHTVAISAPLDARRARSGAGVVVSEHSPTVLLRGTTPDYCSAEITMTGEAQWADETFGISVSDTPKPVWSPYFPTETFWVQPSDRYDDVVHGYALRTEIDGIEPGATGTFTRSAAAAWSSPVHFPINHVSLAVYGDVTFTITEHRTKFDYPGSDTIVTDAVRGTVSGHLTDDGGPDAHGFIDVHASFAFSEAGCYPNLYPDR